MTTSMKISKNSDYKETLSLRTDDPKTNDPTYAAYWSPIHQLPLFISYPRSGAHWINAVMELFFDRPRLPIRRATFLDPDRKDWGWFHDHDTIAFADLTLDFDELVYGAMYLYRNPVDVVFSWIIYNFNNGQSLKLLPKDRLEEYVVAVSQQYRDHLTKWLIEAPKKLKDKNYMFVRYENFKKDPINEFNRIQSFLTDNSIAEIVKHTTPDLVERIEMSFEIVTPVELSKRRTEWKTLSDFMLTDQYKEERADFVKTYEEDINSIAITEELKEFFE